MVTCAACGHENPAESRFCNQCGARVVGSPAHEERKVVTVLFADLVGFTSRAENLDPEDVRALLSPFWQHLRGELERFGGTVEKFIGDAVMAVFGAPVAHEDDPERALRAALAIRDWARTATGALQVRIGVNTGEALVLPDARPAEGEGMAAGDVVNTAARLQVAAPVNGVLVGEATYRATHALVEYREAEPVHAKGKSEPLHVWEALSVLPQAGVESAAAAPFVGRADELGLLVSAFERARHESRPQLVTVVGEPGIGKSRLAAELLSLLERDPSRPVWRRGRSLPYGTGISFWALGEIAKAELGVLETDGADAARAKLADGVARLFDDADEQKRIADRVLPLLGLAGSAAEPADRDGSFAAWGRFIEAIARSAPTVLLFEDLHWADDDLVDFVDELVDRMPDVPLLVVCTTRPELFERRPSWGDGRPGAVAVSLGPLSDGETVQLLQRLAGGVELTPAVQETLLGYVAGNPFYAEQYARALDEQGCTPSELPETVHGLIAARVDLLPADEKALLQDAAVIGRTFWPGALATLGGADAASIEERLASLVQKQFVRRDRVTSVAGETEYSFVHALVRDVVYRHMPRALRADRHARAAAWIDALSPDRAADRAELLAHHYDAAIELGKAAGIDVTLLHELASTAFAHAGARASTLHAYARASSHYTAAIELVPEDDPRREVLLLRRAASDERLGSLTR
jgi:class 3 adenylate cyclase